jgi:FkbM family methyltransferase
MSLNIQGSIKAAARALNLDLRRYSARNVFMKRVAKILADDRLDLVVDVGANRGQFANELFREGYAGAILSFEPIPEAHAKLVAASATSGRDWRVAPPMALTETAGVAEINLAANSASSSLLSFGEAMATAVPVAAAAGRQTIQTRRLDEVLPTLGVEGRRFGLKVDTQGSEMAVLKGAESVEAQIDLLIIEVSIAQFYNGQPAYHELDELLRSKGWRLIDIEPGYRHPSSLHLCEFDAVYRRAQL